MLSVKRRGAVLAILKEGRLNKIPVNLFQNPSICLGGDH